jgi:hypothetical protein
MKRRLFRILPIWLAYPYPRGCGKDCAVMLELNLLGQVNAYRSFALKLRKVDGYI